MTRSLEKLSPTRLFWLFVGVHLFLWTLIPTLASPNVPLDVIEGYAWGREWLIGTYKHPPMQAWWLEILALITNRAPWAHFFASQLAIAIAFWAVWQTGKRLTTEKNALIAVLFLEGAVYYNFTSPEFNPNVLQMPFWALACWSFHRAVKDNRVLDWILLGLWAAGGLYTKYSMGLLLAVLALLLILHPEARKRLKTSGPFLTLIIALLLFAPHLKWLIDHNFLPISYAQSRTDEATNLWTQLFQPFKFLAAQALSLLPLIILFFFTARFRPSWRMKPKSFNDIFLHAVTFGPLAIIVIYSLISGFRPRDMWGSCLWNFIGLWLVTFALPPLDTASLKRFAIKRFAIAWSVIFALGLIVMAASNALYPYIKHKGQRVNFPGQALSEKITSAWRERFDTSLPFVIGDTWLAGNVAYYAGNITTGERPRVFIAADYKINPQMKPKDIQEKGGILVWSATNANAAQNMPADLRTKFSKAEIRPSLALTPQTGADIGKVFIGWAILPPSPSAP